MDVKPKKYKARGGRSRYLVDLTFRHYEQVIRLRQRGFMTAKEAIDWAEVEYLGIRSGTKPIPVPSGRPGRKKKVKRLSCSDTFCQLKKIWENELSEQTIKGYEIVLKKYIAPTWNTQEIESMKPENIQALYVGIPSSAVNKVTNILKSLKNHQKELGLNLSHWVDCWERTQIRTRKSYLKPNEIPIFLANCKPELRPYMVILIHTGIRIGELRALDWSQVDRRNKLVNICASESRHCKRKGTKTGKSRQVPLTDTALQAFSELASAQGSAWIVSGDVCSSKNVNDIAAEVVRLRPLFPRIEQEDPTDPLVVHSLRHTCASSLIHAGVTLEKIGKILGQSTKRITEQYSHLATSDMHDTVALLPDFSFSFGS